MFTSSLVDAIGTNKKVTYGIGDSIGTLLPWDTPDAEARADAGREYQAEIDALRTPAGFEDVASQRSGTLSAIVGAQHLRPGCKK